MPLRPLLLNLEIAAVEGVAVGTLTLTASATADHGVVGTAAGVIEIVGSAVADHPATVMPFPIGGVVGAYRPLSPRAAALELDRLRGRKRRRPAPVVGTGSGVLVLEARARAEASGLELARVDAPSEVVAPELPPVVAVVAGEITIVAHAIAETWDFDRIRQEDEELIAIVMMMQAMKRPRRASSTHP